MRLNKLGHRQEVLKAVTIIFLFTMAWWRELTARRRQRRRRCRRRVFYIVPFSTAAATTVHGVGVLLKVYRVPRNNYKTAPPLVLHCLVQWGLWRQQWRATTCCRGIYIRRSQYDHDNGRRGWLHLFHWHFHMHRLTIITITCIASATIESSQVSNNSRLLLCINEINKLVMHAGSIWNRWQFNSFFSRLLPRERRFNPLVPYI